MSDVSDRVLMQRIRNRIIEVFELFLHDDCIENFGTDEIIEFWFDFVDDKKLVWFSKPVFTQQEVNAVLRFNNVLNENFQKVPDTFSVKMANENSIWNTLKKCASEEYEIFMERGLLDENEEIT